MSRPTTQRSYFKDIQQLYRTIETSTNGQASIISVNEMSVLISLHPKSGYNAHADFTVKVRSCLAIIVDTLKIGMNFDGYLFFLPIVNHQNAFNLFPF
uniref:Uncharacterized protein n=1 Tax=Mesocestoides corti TaxID=53468 RepID=A0A5K3G6A9_MESCO